MTRDGSGRSEVAGSWLLVAGGPGAEPGGRDGGLRRKREEDLAGFSLGRSRVTLPGH